MFGTLTLKATFPRSDMTQKTLTHLLCVVQLCLQLRSAQLTLAQFRLQRLHTLREGGYVSLPVRRGRSESVHALLKDTRHHTIISAELSLSLGTSISLLSPAAVCARSQPVPASSAAQRDALGWRCGRRWLPAGSGRERALALSERSLRPEL